MERRRGIGVYDRDKSQGWCLGKGNVEEEEKNDRWQVVIKNIPTWSLWKKLWQKSRVMFGQEWGRKEWQMTDHNRRQTGGQWHSHCMKDKGQRARRKKYSEKKKSGKWSKNEWSPIEIVSPVLQEELQLSQVIMSTSASSSSCTSWQPSDLHRLPLLPPPHRRAAPACSLTVILGVASSKLPLIPSSPLSPASSESWTNGVLVKILPPLTVSQV